MLLVGCFKVYILYCGLSCKYEFLSTVNMSAYFIENFIRIGIFDYRLSFRLCSCTTWVSFSGVAHNACSLVTFEIYL